MNMHQKRNRARHLFRTVLTTLVMSTMVACAGDQKAESDGTGETFVLGPSEVFLQPATDVGPEPFVITPLAPAPDPELARPVVAEEAEVQSAAGAAIQASSGSQPGLYGGSRDDATCDTEQLVSFLGANPDKAQAWVAALNADATLRYEGGQLTPSVIPQYIGGLTPLILLEDTRVTNHGFADGKPNPWQSVLQKGTAVLIDQYGVPRARCYCGNPLIAPIPAPSAPTYVGRQWADFDPTKVDVVSPAPEPIEIFQVQDKTGAIVERPRSGSEDPFSAIEDSLSESTEPAEAQPASESTEAVQEALPGESYAVESYGDQVTGRISMKVPTDWEVVDDFVVYDDPGVAGQVLATAPDAEKITNPEELDAARAGPHALVAIYERSDGRACHHPGCSAEGTDRWLFDLRRPGRFRSPIAGCRWRRNDRSVVRLW